MFSVQFKSSSHVYLNRVVTTRSEVLIDSGASRCVTPHLELLTHCRQVPITISGVHGTHTREYFVGTLVLFGVVFENAICIPDVKNTICAMDAILQKFPGWIGFNGEVCRHSFSYGVACGKQTVIGRVRPDGLYVLTALPTLGAAVHMLSTANQLKREAVNKLHSKLGHMSKSKMKLAIMKQGPIDGCTVKDLELLTPCDACLSGDAKKIAHPKEGHKMATFFGQHIDADCTGTQAVITPSKASVGLLAIDRKTNFAWGFPQRSKMDSVGNLSLIIKRDCNGKTERVKTDQGSEFVNYDMGALCEETNTKHVTSNAGDSPQNGAAERIIGVIWAKMRIVLVSSKLPMSWWGEALNYCVFAYNYSPCYANPDCMSPWEMRYGRPPDISRLHQFGEVGYVLPIPSQRKKRHNLQKRGLYSFCVGFDDINGTPGWRMWCPETKTVIVSADVLWTGRQHKTAGSAQENLDLLQPAGIDNFGTEALGLVEVFLANADLYDRLLGREQVDTSADVADLATLMRVAAFEVQASDVFEPKTTKQAITCEDKLEWRASMDSELGAIERHVMKEDVDIADLPPGANIIPSKWVYKVKQNGDGSLKRRKSRIVALGFRGKEGVDYNLTYSPVATSIAIRLLFAIAMTLNLVLRQIDFKEAFLNSNVKPGVNIYVKPPPGSNTPPNKVWRLIKMLYGLKDAPLRWHETLVQALCKCGYKQCVDEPCLFYRIEGTTYSILTIVVDDIIVASNSTDVNDTLIKQLSKLYDVADLGEPKYVLGMHVRREGKHKMKLSQRLYIQGMIEKYEQTKAKPVYTPAIKDYVLTTDMCGSKTKQLDKPYRSLVGALMYATITRPDISVIVSVLAKFLEDPGIQHWNAAIRVLRYLKTTIDVALCYDVTSSARGRELQSYSDSSFDTCPMTSRSRTGYCIRFNGCCILWKSKLQPVVALSSTEAELIAMCGCAQDTVWLRRILRDLKFPQSGPTEMFGDNLAAKSMAENHMIRARTRHIKRRYNYLREQVSDRELRVRHIPGTENPADFLTKILGKRLFYKHRKSYVI